MQQSLVNVTKPIASYQTTTTSMTGNARCKDNTSITVSAYSVLLLPLYSYHIHLLLRHPHAYIDMSLKIHIYTDSSTPWY